MAQACLVQHLGSMFNDTDATYARINLSAVGQPDVAVGMDELCEEDAMTEQRRKRVNGAQRPSEGPGHSVQLIDSEAIARRAFELYQLRGDEDGHDLEDWFQAEDETRARGRDSTG